MATSERSRHELYSRLEEVLGPVHTDTLMDHLPPGGWSDVATRQDLRHLDSKIDHLDRKVDHLDRKARLMSRMHRALWMQTAALLVVVLGALATALVALAGA